MRSNLWLILPLVMIFSLSVAAQEEEDIDWKKGAWGDLSTHIGTYHYDAVLADDRVKTALIAVMGEDNYNRAKDTLEVQTPIGFEDDCLLLSGNAAGAGGSQSAFIAVCVYEGKVHAALHDKSEFDLYTKAARYDYLPGTMKLWIRAELNPGLLDMPDGVTLQPAP